jgi:hypothetical protein
MSTDAITERSTISSAESPRQDIKKSSIDSSDFIPTMEGN